MAPSSKKPAKANKSVTNRTLSSLKRYFSVNFAKSLIFDPQKLPIVAFLLVIAEVILNLVVIQNVRYTEIDWKAYMQEVEGFLNGTFDYSLLKGDTGPLVYPAGFVYFYSILYYATQHGQNVRFAQYIFALLYIILIFLVFRLYIKSKKVPPYVIILSICTSYRIHSIFILRMFNDPIAVILLYAAINLFVDGRWNYGSLLFSLAVSVKMNILLFAPALLTTYLLALGFVGTVKQLAICASVQLVLGLPFLLTHPLAYIIGAFDLSRVFLYEWTVNWRFLPEDIFVDKNFHLILLGVHVALLLLFLPGWITYLRSFGHLLQVSKDLGKSKKKKEHKVDMSSLSRLLLLPLFISNLIGIACARSLHYQFYVWYYHSLPYLVWSTIYGVPTRLALLGIIELCWNTFPSTVFSSAALHLCHITILVGLYLSRHQSAPTQPTQKPKVKFSE